MLLLKTNFNWSFIIYVIIKLKFDYLISRVEK